MNTWRTLPSGQLEVNGKVPLLSGQSRAAFRAQVVDRWGDMVRRRAAAVGVPVVWVLATIWAESGGNPSAKSSDGGCGLMQLTSPAALAGHTGAETIADPELNVRLGAELMGRITKTGDSLVEVASKYNAGAGADGAPHPGGEPWGYRETAGHIARVVAASNTAIDLRAATPAPGRLAPARTASSSLGPMLTIVGILRWLK